MTSRSIVTAAFVFFLLRFLDLPEPHLTPNDSRSYDLDLGLDWPTASNWSTAVTNQPLELLPCVPSILGQKVVGPCKITVVITMCEKTSQLNSVVPKNLQKLKFSFSRQYNQTLTLIKSMLVALKHSRLRGVSVADEIRIRHNVHLELVIISNNQESVRSVQTTVSKWNAEYTQNLRLIYQPAVYLKGYEWMENLYAPCSTLRLLLPQLMPHVDTVIYTDTDIIALQHILDLWNQLVTFTTTTQVAMVRSRRQYNVRPLVQRLGLVKIPAHNSGVMIMNLTRLRDDQDWKAWLVQGCQHYEEFLQWADQDIMDVYFHLFPNRLHTMPCHWNFVPPFFVNQTLCNPKGVGAAMLHGISSHFFKLGRIGEVYKAFEQIELQPQSGFTVREFVSRLKLQLKSTSTCQIYEEIHSCDNSYFEEAITKKLDNYF